MIISDSTWTSKYINRLRKVNETAADKMRKYLESHTVVSLQDWNALIDYAYAVSSSYGESAAAIACEFYDAVAIASGVTLAAATPAATATYAEVAKSIRGTGKSGNTNLMANSIGRLVKMAGVDTTMHNAIRDGAEWAWIPRGDTCIFCLTLASRGWQRASAKALKGGHAEHIHANCDCTYAVRFSSKDNVQGYDPKKYRDIYDAAEGKNSEEKINFLRRELYAEKKKEINAQKRAAYKERTERDQT